MYTKNTAPLSRIFSIKYFCSAFVFYKGHFESGCTQLSPEMSFTIYCKGHTIHAGPERARRSLQSSDHNKMLQTEPWRFPVKSSFKIKSITSKKLYVHRTKNPTV